MAAPAVHNNFEHLKRKYIEDAISLAESFARLSEHYRATEDQTGAISAARQAEHFYREAIEMLHLLHDKEECGDLSGQLDRLRRDLGLSWFVA